MKKNIATVIVDLNLNKELDYLIPDDMLDQIEPGMRVEIPIKNTLHKGYVLNIKEESSFNHLKSIQSIVNQEVISKELFKLCLWMSDYYVTPLSKVLKTVIPTSTREETEAKYDIFILANKSKKELLQLIPKLQKTSSLQAHIVELFLNIKKGIKQQELIHLCDCSLSPIESLVEKKILQKEKVLRNTEDILEEKFFFPTKKKKLSHEQHLCLKAIEESIHNKKYQAHLIFGVTGSGKTEIYLQAIQKVLDQNQTAIVLVPEVALTSQTVERFRSRFSQEKIAVIHHKRSKREKFETYQMIREKKAKIIIGARSAIFAPAPDLGIIIVDEEHDTSYKQTEEAPAYHARHVALMRAKFQTCPVILASATPSIESFTLAEKQKFLLHVLKNRHNSSQLPKVTIVDMKEEILKNRGTIFSSRLLEAIEERYKKGEQTLLFLNRRGYNPFIVCVHCGKKLECPHCSVSLTFHKKNNLFSCHSCGYAVTSFEKCPDCQEGLLEYKGYGTELVETALKAIFPYIRTMRMDRDTIKTKLGHENLYHQFRSGKADVLIGTQMIVKGFHFPLVTLVGVLNSDAALNIPDFRSSEYVFQLITQVAGRAGREELEGQVFIQTFLKDHPTIRLASEQNYEDFYAWEMENRKSFLYPPYLRMTKLVFSSPDEKLALHAAENWRKNLISELSSGCQIHPVMPSGLKKMQDDFHYFILIRHEKSISSILGKMKNQTFLPAKVKILIDIDPIYTFF
jgi:primosomal protein N' (replication factor Y)